MSASMILGRASCIHLNNVSPRTVSVHTPPLWSPYKLSVQVRFKTDKRGRMCHL